MPYLLVNQRIELRVRRGERGLYERKLYQKKWIHFSETFKGI